MTRDEILQSLTERKDLKNHINKLTGGNKYYREEMYQELFLILAEMPNEKLEQIYKDGYLDFWIIKIISNQFKSSTSTYHHKVRKPIQNKVDHISRSGLDTLDELPGSDEQNMTPILLQELDNVIDNLFWYDQQLLRLYLEEGSIKRVSKRTDINPSYIGESLAKSKKVIRTQLTNKLNDLNDQ